MCNASATGVFLPVRPLPGIHCLARAGRVALRSLVITLSLSAFAFTAMPLAAQSEEAAPESDPESTITAIENAAAASAPAGEAASAARSRRKECQPDIGCVTSLPLPRFVSLKGNEGNVRRGPGLTHRIDWVFTHPGMPLRVTAEYENWRRVEDMDGAGGWVHYALISGTRSVLVITDMAEFRASPDSGARVIAQAEMGVVARILQCNPDWCRISTGGEKGWVHKSALWGVDPGEIVD